MKTAIVLAAFGSRNKNALTALNHIVERVEKAYPDTPVRVAYTSKAIRGHMKKQARKSIPSHRLLIGSLPKV